jgi:alpha-D-xyloside xylohydrolase
MFGIVYRISTMAVQRYLASTGVLTMKKTALFIALFIAAGLQPLFAQVSSFIKESDGVLFAMPNNGKMKVQVCSDKVIRVVYTLQSTIPRADSNYIVVKGTWNPVTFTVEDGTSAVSITTATVKAEVSKTTGAVSFYAGGTLILQETQAKKLTQKTMEGLTAYEGTINFNQTQNNEGIYGFGNLQNIPYYLPFNLRGQSLLLTQLNEVDCSPFFMSTRGFGVLWINYSKMTVNSPLTLWCNHYRPGPTMAQVGVRVLAVQKPV